MRRASPLAFAAAVTLSLANPSRAEPTVLAEYPSGTFLENLTVQPDGGVLFTSYFDRQLGQLSRDNAATGFVTLQAHPVGVLAVEGGYVVTAHGTPFTEGPAFTQTQQILVLDPSGAVLSSTAVPDALFLNGLTQTTAGDILIADSIAGTIWQFDPDVQNVTLWFSHELLTQNPDLPVFAPGANGVKQDGNRLLVSNSGRGAIYEIAMDSKGRPTSDPVSIAETGPVDDFYVDDGRIIFTTHGAALKAIETDGSVSTLMAEGCDGCTSVTRRGDAYLVLTTGGLLEGHTDPARILSIPTE
ncbi:MAG: hypothetical protein AAFO72_01425 [Pseudomonadota bacterium]